MGYFFGFKLHFVVNDKGEIIDFVLTAGNVDDRTPLKEENFLKRIFGKLFADKGLPVRDSLNSSLSMEFILLQDCVRI